MSRTIWSLTVLSAALIAGGWVVFDLTIHESSSYLRRVWRNRRGALARQGDEAPLSHLEAWLANGDPLATAPAIEMGVWLTPTQVDELDCLAAETWPRNEYFTIADLYMRGETS